MQINKEGKIFLGFIVVLILAIAAAFNGTGEKGQGNATSTIISMTSETKDGLKIVDETIGTGAEAVAGKNVTVHYVGTLANGKKFDSSRDRGTPFTFALGAGQVIRGWDEGVAGMKVGGTRKLTIPPELAYGSQSVGNGLIPPNSTLVFEVELLGVK